MDTQLVILSPSLMADTECKSAVKLSETVSKMAKEMSFERVTEDNVETFKHTIRLCLFPVGYPKSFFKDAAVGKINAFLVVIGASGVVGCMAWREMKDRSEVEILGRILIQS